MQIFEQRIIGYACPMNGTHHAIDQVRPGKFCSSVLMQSILLTERISHQRSFSSMLDGKQFPVCSDLSVTESTFTRFLDTKVLGKTHS